MNSCVLDSPRFCVNFPKRPVSQKEGKKLNKVKKKKNSSGSLSINCIILNVYFVHSDRVLCHFCFKPEKVTNEVLGVDYARKSQMLISSIILLKTALDALPLLSKVSICLLAMIFHIIFTAVKYVLKCHFIS